MKIVKPDAIEMIPLDDIIVGERIRALDPAAVQVIFQSVLELGHLTTPIHVRKTKGGFELIDGRHRLEVARKMGAPRIAARVWTCTVKEARFMEGDANLANAHLTPLDMAVNLARRKAAFLELHPEKAQGVAGGLARHGEASDIMSFAEFMGAVLGVSKRQVQRIVSAGERLDPRDVGLLRQAPKPLAMNDIYELAKIDSPTERYDVVEIIGTGQAKTVTKARKFAAAKRGDAPAPVDPVDAEFQALLKAWQRARKSARLQFLDKVSRELREITEGGDE